MGFRRPAYIHFDQMSLADDAAEKNLLLQLADRDIISHETILERFKEIPSVEKIRLQREIKNRDKEAAPNKAGPYHNPQHEHDLEKIALQGGKVTPQDLGMETSVPDDILMPKPQEQKPGGPPNKNKKNDDKNDDKGGRPKFKQDKEPRKKRTETPKSKPGLAETIMWAQGSFDAISEIVTEAYLKMNNKRNLRQVTKAEISKMEKLKLDVLTNLEPLEDATAAAIYKHLSEGSLCPKDFLAFLEQQGASMDSLNIDVYRQYVVNCYVEYMAK
jgi:hypothetical protein